MMVNFLQIFPLERFNKTNKITEQINLLSIRATLARRKTGHMAVARQNFLHRETSAVENFAPRPCASVERENARRGSAARKGRVLNLFHFSRALF